MDKGGSGGWVGSCRTSSWTGTRLHVSVSRGEEEEPCIDGSPESSPSLTGRPHSAAPGQCVRFQPHGVH